jgi:uncharacterized protein YbaR (Trm112 family)
MEIDQKFIEILACPKCKGSVTLMTSGEGIKCESCGLVYPIREGIPVMLIEEAREDD